MTAKYNAGLSQEVGMSQESEFEFAPKDSEYNTHLMTQVKTGSFYHDFVAVATSAAFYAEMCPNYKYKAAMMVSDLDARLKRMAVDDGLTQQERRRQSNSEIIDLYHGADTRKKSQRIKGAGEPERKRKFLYEEIKPEPGQNIVN